MTPDEPERALPSRFVMRRYARTIQPSANVGGEGGGAVVASSGRVRRGLADNRAQRSVDLPAVERILEQSTKGINVDADRKDGITSDLLRRHIAGGACATPRPSAQARLPIDCASSGWPCGCSSRRISSASRRLGTARS